MICTDTENMEEGETPAKSSVRRLRTDMMDVLMRHELELEAEMQGYRDRIKELKRTVGVLRERCDLLLNGRNAAAMRCSEERRKREDLERRVAQLEEENKRLLEEQERHKDSVVCLSEKLAASEQENKRLRRMGSRLPDGATGHDKRMEGGTAPTHFTQNNYYNSCHVSESRLSDTRIGLSSPEQNGYTLIR